ncbi:MAG: peptidylprolyl isomerase [Sedimentisphaerales bacterium]|nr:peptidylprolyl isomerase [Sedimentisphaerales bacterium]
MTQARTGNKVKLHFTGKLDDGTVFASSAESAPIEFTVGEGKVLPGLEEAVEGMAVGDAKTVTIPSEQAYGPRRDDLTQEIPRDRLPSDLSPEVGQRLRIEQTGGDTVLASVAAVTDETITIDANHPLAGQAITLELEMVEIA